MSATLVLPYPQAEARCLYCEQDLGRVDAYSHLSTKHPGLEYEHFWLITIQECYKAEMNNLAKARFLVSGWNRVQKERVV